MHANSITPAPKAQPAPIFIGFDTNSGKPVATFEIGNIKRDVPYAEVRAYVAATNAALVPAWFIAGGK